MALLEKFLRIKKSTIPRAGKGLFTQVDIPKGTRIVQYQGKRMTWAQAQKQPDEQIGYIFFFHKNYVLDAFPMRKSFARYANDAAGLTRLPKVRNNCIYVTEKGKCYIQATRNLKKGEEIFVSYGQSYWNSIRYNIKHGTLKKK